MAVDTECDILPWAGGESSVERGIADELLRLGAIAMQFSSVERVPRHADGRRETDVEHSYMLSLIAAEIAAEYYPHLDPGLVAEFGNVHDLIEIRTTEISTFALSDEELEQKHINEQQALDEFLEALPRHTASILKRYELQEEPEARLVRAVDKLLPLIVDIHGDGVRVLCEDYGVMNVEAFKDAHRPHQARFERMFPEFPELLGAHVLLTEFLAARFAVQSDRFQSATPIEDNTLF